LRFGFAAVIMDGYTRAVGREGARRSGADPRTRARDEHDPVAEIVDHAGPLS
jgi:hypothetical protein